MAHIPSSLALLLQGCNVGVPPSGRIGPTADSEGEEDDVGGAGSRRDVVLLQFAVLPLDRDYVTEWKVAKADSFSSNFTAIGGLPELQRVVKAVDCLPTLYRKGIRSHPDCRCYAAELRVLITKHWQLADGKTRSEVTAILNRQQCVGNRAPLLAPAPPTRNTIRPGSPLAAGASPE